MSKKQRYFLIHPAEAQLGKLTYQEGYQYLIQEHGLRMISDVNKIRKEDKLIVPVKNKNNTSGREVTLEELGIATQKIPEIILVPFDPKQIETTTEFLMGTKMKDNLTFLAAQCSFDHVLDSHLPFIPRTFFHITQETFLKLMLDWQRILTILQRLGKSVPPRTNFDQIALIKKGEMVDYLRSNWVNMDIKPVVAVLQDASNDVNQSLIEKIDTQMFTVHFLLQKLEILQKDSRKRWVNEMNLYLRKPKGEDIPHYHADPDRPVHFVLLLRRIAVDGVEQTDYLKKKIRDLHAALFDNHRELNSENILGKVALRIKDQPPRVDVFHLSKNMERVPQLTWNALLVNKDDDAGISRRDWEDGNEVFNQILGMM